MSNNKKIKIAIVGAGLAGLATALHLKIRAKETEVVLFDHEGIGGGASGIAAGLLHPYGGAHAKLNWQGQEGLEATKELLIVASEALGEPVADFSGILRIAVTEEQQSYYHQSAQKNSELQWLNADETQERIEGISHLPSIFVPSGITVNSPLYLQGLWKACEALGVDLSREKVHLLEELDRFDYVIVTVGAAIQQFSQLKHLVVTQVKGQLLKLRWPKNLKPLPCSISSQMYVAMHSDGESCICGSTYERDFTSSHPDLEVAKKEIFPKLSSFLPSLVEEEVLDCYSGIRASIPGHKPLIKQIDNRLFVYTGLGSKGLLYHALFARELVLSILKQK